MRQLVQAQEPEERVVLDDALPLIAWFGVALIILAGMIAVQLQPARRAEPPPQMTND